MINGKRSYIREIYDNNILTILFFSEDYDNFKVWVFIQDNKMMIGIPILKPYRTIRTILNVL